MSAQAHRHLTDEAAMKDDREKMIESLLDDDSLLYDPTLRRIPIDRIRPNAWNPNEMDKETQSWLQEDIEEIGFNDAITVVPDVEDKTFQILGGEHRWRAAKAAGMTHVDAKILTSDQWADEDLQKWETMRLNVLRGDLNPQKFMSLYHEQAKKHGADNMRRLFGFADKDRWRNLVEKMKADVRKSLPPDVRDEFDKKAGNAETVQEVQSALQYALETRRESLEKQSYLIIDLGGREHIYLKLDQRARRAVDKVVDYLEYSGQDANAFFLPVLEEAGRHAADLWQEAVEQSAEDGPAVLEADDIDL